MDSDNSSVAQKNKDEKESPFLVIMVDSGNNYYTRRKSIRNSWMKYLTSEDSPLTPENKKRIVVKFVLGKKEGVNVSEEIKQYNDIVMVDVEDSYYNLALKTLHFMKWTSETYGKNGFTYFMHADDDSFVRLDLLLSLLETKPTKNYCYGYMWNNGLRVTKPLRNPTAKSYMPYDQYPEDTPYPPFACGCGFVLTNDLIGYLVENLASFKFYRLVDVAFGMYLAPLGNRITFENDERVRPYRHLPLFDPETIIQHYMKPEEFRGYYQKSIGKESHSTDQKIPENLYSMMANMGLMKR